MCDKFASKLGAPISLVGKVVDCSEKDPEKGRAVSVTNTCNTDVCVAFLIGGHDSSWYFPLKAGQCKKVLHNIDPLSVAVYSAEDGKEVQPAKSVFLDPSCYNSRCGRQMPVRIQCDSGGDSSSSSGSGSSSGSSDGKAGKHFFQTWYGKAAVISAMVIMLILFVLFIIFIRSVVRSRQENRDQFMAALMSSGLS